MGDQISTGIIGTSGHINKLNKETVLVRSLDASFQLLLRQVVSYFTFEGAASMLP